MAAVFDRWKHAMPHSGPFLVYKQYYEELNRYYWSSYAAHPLTYKGMKLMGFTWSSNPDVTLNLPPHNHSFKTLKGWSKAYDSLQGNCSVNPVIAI